MASRIGDLFGKGGAAEQLLIWQVLGQLLGAALAPELELLTREVNKALPSTPLSPVALADMVVRNIVERGQAAAYARESGVADGDFERMVQSAGEPPSPQEMLAAVRRGVAPLEGTGPDAVSFQQAVAESRIYTKYTKVLQALADLPIGVADAVDAVVEGQIDRATGEHFAYLNGISPDNFAILVNTRGNPPSPSELAELLKRGLIPLEGTGPDAISFQQGIFEGASKDKWWTFYAKLADYIPPPRTVTAMISEGSLTDDQGLALLQASGLSSDLAASYVASAHRQKTATERDLTVGAIKALYQDGLIDAATAEQLLALLRYSTEDTALYVDLWNFQSQQAQIKTALSRLQSLYVAHKLDAVTTRGFMEQLGVPSEGQQKLLTLWNLEAAANVKLLTPGEIADSVFYQIITFAQGVIELVNLGYTERDATIRIGVRLHGIPADVTLPPA